MRPIIVHLHPGPSPAWVKRESKGVMICFKRAYIALENVSRRAYRYVTTTSITAISKYRECHLFNRVRCSAVYVLLVLAVPPYGIRSTAVRTVNYQGTSSGEKSANGVSSVGGVSGLCGRGRQRTEAGIPAASAALRPRTFLRQHFSGNATCCELKTLDFSLFCKGILTTCGCANSATKMRESNVYLTTPFLG